MGLVTADIAVSLDLVGAGRDQSLEHPFGPHVGHRLHTWMFEYGEESADEIAAILDAGAYVMGRHMFGRAVRRETATSRSPAGSAPSTTISPPGSSTS